MNAFELLKKDHRKVSQIFEAIEAAQSATKSKLFRELKTELELHAHVEEVVFYPRLEKTDEARDITLEAYEEHSVVKSLLAELESGDARSDEWTAKLTVLKENVEHHVKEEEGELFDKAGDVLSDEQIEELGTEMEAEKVRARKGTPGKRSTKAAASASKGKSKTAGKAEPGKKRGGLISSIANLVGLGSASSPSPSRGRKSAKATPSKGKKAPSKTAKKAAKKTSGKKKAVKTASRGTASKTAAGKGRKRAGAKSATKSNARKSTARKTARKR